MERKKLSLQFKKKAAVILHGIFLFAALAGLCLMHSNSHYGTGLTWLNQESYEETSSFSKQFQSDLVQIFDYIQYKDIFETAGKPNLSKPMLSVNYGPSKDKIYTLDEVIQYAKKRGYFLDENYNIVGKASAPTEDDRQEVSVNWKAYDPDSYLMEPGDAYFTMEDLSLELLKHLSRYYSTYQRLIDHPSNLYFKIVYTNVSGNKKTIYSNLDSQTLEEDLKSMGRYFYVSGNSIIIDTNLQSLPKGLTALLEQSNPYPDTNYTMTAAVDTSYPAADAYQEGKLDYLQERSYFVTGLIWLCIGLFICAVTLYYLILVSGHKTAGSNEIRLHGFDMISMESGAVMFIVLTLFGLFIAEKIGYEVIYVLVSDHYWDYAEQILHAVVIYCGVAGFGFSLLRRYKARTLWKGSLLRRFLGSLSSYYHNRSYTIRIITGYLPYVLANVVSIGALFFLLSSWEFLWCRAAFFAVLCLWIVLTGWLFHTLYLSALQKDKISEAIHNISKGDTAYKIDTSIFAGKEKELADSINNVSTGLESALLEKIKSEKLKADLITNVSHDIKTPLTSIINYVDLMRRANIQDERVQGYLDVLEQKSQRLKTLTEDLVEASKASSGNVKLEITTINLVELVQQTRGEFEDKFATRHLELVTDLPENDIFIEADGRHLWRVLENLYNNAFKYSMEHSRVYVEIDKQERKAAFIIKNVSENPLNITGEELTERFVRGDVARTTEGSGLGLSIAKSLTELQGGKFNIYIDGDLFKVQVSFPVKEL